MEKKNLERKLYCTNDSGDMFFVLEKIPFSQNCR